MELKQPIGLIIYAPVSSKPNRPQRQSDTKLPAGGKRPSWVVGLSVTLAVALTAFGILSTLLKPLTDSSGRSTRKPPPANPATLAQAPPTGTVSVRTPGGVTAVDAQLSGAQRATENVNRGTEFFHEGRFEEAAALYADAVKLAPDDETVHFDLALALAKLGKLNEAKQHYREALRIFPDYAEAHNNLGNLLASEGRLSEAMEQLNEAVKAAPDSASAHNNLGTTLMRQGKATEAFEHFSEAVRIMPDYVEAQCNLGNACLAQGKINEALAAFKTALRLKPDFAPASSGLARAQQKQFPATTPLPGAPPQVP